MTLKYINTENFRQVDTLSRFIQEIRQDLPDPDIKKVVATLQEVNTELQQLVKESVQIQILLDKARLQL